MPITLIELFVEEEITFTILKQELAKSFTVKDMPKENTLLVGPPTKDLLIQKAQLVLKKKEIDVIDLLSKGHDYNSIATTLGMTINGVRYYIKKIYRKLNVDNSRKAISVYNGLEEAYA